MPPAPLYGAKSIQDMRRGDFANGLISDLAINEAKHPFDL